MSGKDLDAKKLTANKITASERLAAIYNRWIENPSYGWTRSGADKLNAERSATIYNRWIENPSYGTLTMAKSFLALLRGINVGGKNIISKEDLKSCFENLGLTNVQTYIQSGNILFDSNDSAIANLTSKIEKGLSKRFNYEADAVVLSKKKYCDAVANAPKNWGNDEEFKHNALFLIHSVTAKSFLKNLPEPKPDWEIVTPAPGVVFWSISKKHQPKTTLMKLAAKPEYKMVTVRNHNTVYRLKELFEQR